MVLSVERSGYIGMMRAMTVDWDCRGFCLYEFGEVGLRNSWL